MSGLGEQIAVLDGLDAFDPEDGRIGQRRAAVTQYARPVMPGVIERTGMVSASGGSNYGGGSSYYPGGPLMPSSVGLAGCGGRGMGNIPNVLPTRRGVIDYSGGANYSGGSSYVPGLPLLPSSSGLADALIKGGYGRPGLGASLVRGGYGRAGLGHTGTAVDEDLAGAMEAVETSRMFSPDDGRIGQQRARIDEYGRQILPGVLERSNVLDASEGANYSGGSSYAPGLPLLPSSVGLAGLSGLEELSLYDQLDAVDDETIGIKRAAKLRKIAGKSKVQSLKTKARRLAKKAQTTRSPRARAEAVAKLQNTAARLHVARGVRREVFARRGGKYAVRRPLWAR